MKKLSVVTLVGFLSAALAGQGTTDLAAWIMSVQPTSRIRSAFSLKDVESLTGVAVLVSGPHQDGAFDFESTTDFGHYNPAFLRLVIDTLLSDRTSATTTRELAQRLFRFRSFRGRLFSLSAARCALQRDPARFTEFQEAYAGLIEAGERFSGYRGALARWNDWDSGYGAEDLAFWSRREWDGTSDLVAEGIRKALRRFVDFATYQARVGCLQGQAPTEPTPLLFTTESFLDHRPWADPSALSCREELIRRHAWGPDGPNTSLDARIDDQEQIAHAMATAGCSPQWVKGPHFGLMVDGNRLRWQPVELQFTLEFTHFDGCQKEKLVDLRVHMTERPENLLLLRAGKPLAAPSFFSEAREEPGAGARSEMVDLASGKIPGLKRLFKSREIGPFQTTESIQPPDRVLATSLWAEFEDGRKTKIAERHGTGKYSYSEPSIENIMILDINGDSEPDFLYDSDNGGRYLALTKDGELLRVITLVTDQFSGVGGC